MADKKFTFFELHLDEGSIQFGPSQIDVGGEIEAEPDESSEDAAGGRCCGGAGKKLLVALVVALVVAAVVKRAVGGPSDLEELDELVE